MTEQSPSPRVTFLRAAEMFEAACGQVDDGQWSLPGLGEWDVRALVGHTLRAVTTVATYLDQPTPETVACETPGAYFAAARDIPGADAEAVAERGRQAGRDLGDDPVASVHLALERTRQALAVVGDDDPVVATVVGGMRLNAYLPTRTFELLAHSLDLADATRVALAAPTDVVESAVQTAAAAVARTSDGTALLRQLVGRPGGDYRPLFG